MIKITAILISSVVLIWVVSPSAGFIPTKFLAWTVKGLDLSLDSALTHKDISRAAILNIAADLLRDNPNPDNPESTSRIATLSDPLSEESLITAYYGERQRSLTRAFQNAIKVIGDANAGVDLGEEKKNAAAHFDSEEFQAGQNRLVELRQSIVTQIQMENYDLARRETGRLFHTLQDFYSHSNWIENGNRLPYHVLGSNNERPSNIADRSTQTCRDCEENGSTLSLRLFGNDVGRIFRPYICSDNIASTLLTSGYHSSQIDVNGREIEKPAGKCSHGGFRDATSDMSSTGGINKDSPFEVWSPHYYLHQEAARVAQQATVDMLQEIRGDVNNDSAFSVYLGLNVPQAISIAYVIDTTGSMSEELPEIRATIQTIRENLKQYMESFSGPIRVRYILVPFNDPDPGITFETEDVEQFLARIAALTADGGGDTPEPSIGAIIRAAEASEPGAPIFVFTDAPASDEDRINEARSLIVRKNVRVFFAFVNIETRKRSLDDKHFQRKRQVGGGNIYERLAELSGGQFLRVRTSEISDLASLVTFSAVQSRRTIFRRSSIVSGTVEHSFPVDSSTVEVTISINGRGIAVTIFTPQGFNPSNLAQYSTSLVSTTAFIAQINVTDNSLRGEWRIVIQSQGSYSIQVLGSSELSFTEELYQIDSSSTFGFSRIDGRPSQGVPIVALISEGSNTSITVNTLNLINANGTILASITNLTTLGGDSYAGVFLPPSEAFVLQLLGMDGNGYTFSHFSDTSVTVSAVDLTLGGNSSGNIIMRPGESRSVTLVLINQREGAQFSLTVHAVAMGTNRTNTGFIGYNLTPNGTFLQQNSSTEINVEIILSNDTTDGQTVTFTVIAESVIERNINDFINFNVIATTRPPPEFNENLSVTTENAAMMLTAPLVMMGIMVALGYLLFY